MRFTWWTYEIAIRRSQEKEVQTFNDCYRAFRGPDAWRKQKHLTDLLIKRRFRERGPS